MFGTWHRNPLRATRSGKVRFIRRDNNEMNVADAPRRLELSIKVSAEFQADPGRKSRHKSRRSSFAIDAGTRRIAAGSRVGRGN